MSENKIVCMCFHHDKKIDDFMHYADVFEEGKALSIPKCYELELKPDCTKVQALKDFKYAMESCGQRVTAVFIPDEPEGAWVDEKVIAISNGEKFGLMSDALNAYGYVKSKNGC